MLQTSRKERLEAIKKIFIERRADDAQRRYMDDDKIIASTCASYEKHLSRLGIHPKDYNEVYELAVERYNEKGAFGAFGVDAVIQGAQKFLAIKAPKITIEKEQKQKQNCSVCSGTGLAFEDGRIKYETQEGKKVAVKCQVCNVS